MDFRDICVTTVVNYQEVNNLEAIKYHNLPKQAQN